jgi:hypothetical protein
MSANAALDDMLAQLGGDVAVLSVQQPTDLVQMSAMVVHADDLSHKLLNAVQKNPPVNRDQVNVINKQNIVLKKKRGKAVAVIDVAKRVQTMPKKKLQICVLLDATGSMTDVIKEVKNSIAAGIESLGHASRIDVSVALVLYRDYAYDRTVNGELIEDRLVVQDFCSVDDFVAKLAGVHEIHLPNAQDEPEDVLGGFNAMLTRLPWDDAALKVCMWSCDSPGHGDLVPPTMYPYEDDHPGPNVDGLTYQGVLKAMMARNINLAFMCIRPAATNHMLKLFTECTDTIAQISLSQAQTQAKKVVAELLQTSVSNSVTYGGASHKGPKPGPLIVKKPQEKNAPPHFVEISGTQLCTKGVSVAPSEVGDRMMELLTAEPVFTEHPIDVKIADAFFARGGVRYAYLAETKKGAKFVAKDFQHDGMDTKKCHVLEAQASIVASHMARFFCDRLKIDPATFKYVQPVIVDRGSAQAQSSRFYSLENFIEGNMEKYNVNTGAIFGERPEGSLLQAFSHYTYHASDAKLMVLDVQGVATPQDLAGQWSYQLTDPAIATVRRDDYPNMTNLGEEAILTFFQFHVCNDTCRQLGLVDADPIQAL